MARPGWYPDPRTRHELRWFDGVVWTDDVADGARTGHDPVLDETPPHPGTAPPVPAGPRATPAPPDPSGPPSVPEPPRLDPGGSSSVPEPPRLGPGAPGLEPAPPPPGPAPPQLDPGAPQLDPGAPRLDPGAPPAGPAPPRFGPGAPPGRGGPAPPGPGVGPPWVPPPPPGPSVQQQVQGQAHNLKRWLDRQMQAAVSQVATRGDPAADPATPILDRPPSPAVLGQWGGLAGAVQKYAVATSGVVGGGEIVGILKAIAGVQDAQLGLLRSIDVKVDALVRGPYETGRTYLDDARRHGPDDPRTRRRLERALDAFHTAHGQSASVQSRALVEYHLGLTSLLLGDRDDAEHWLARSHASAMAVVDELARMAQNVKVLKSPTGTAAAVWFYPAGVVVLGIKFRKMVAAQRAQQALVDLLPFVDCVTWSHNAVATDDDDLGSVRLVKTGDDAFELVAVEPADVPAPADPDVV